MEWPREEKSYVLREDRIAVCKAATHFLRRWFLKKRPVCPTSWGNFGPRHRLSLLKPRHLPSSHTRTLRPIVSWSRRWAPTCPMTKRTSLNVTQFLEVRIILFETAVLWGIWASEKRDGWSLPPAVASPFLAAFIKYMNNQNKRSITARIPTIITAPNRDNIKTDKDKVWTL